MKYSLSPLLILLLALTSCGNPVDYEAVKSYQDPSLTALSIAPDTVARALLVFPHADDELTVAGLVSKMKEQGMEVHLLTLGADIDDPERREREAVCAAEKLGIDHFEQASLPNNSWNQVLSDSIVYWYDHRDEIKARIREKVDAFRPHVLVTYDTEIGGYGHPEHRISAELVEEIFEEGRGDSTFLGQQLFQMTLTEKLEEFLVKGRESYDLALERTGSAGLPAPDVSLDIQPYWKVKDEAGACYVSQAKTLKKFHLVSKEGHFEEHAAAFSHEYYRVVER